MNLVIVGGVAAGASAATRARRLSEDAHIVVFERGPYVSFANCGLPYHIGGMVERRESLLVARPESLEGRFRLDLRLRSEVTAIDRTRGEVEARAIESGRTYREPYDRLILAPGASPIIPPVPGTDGRRVHTLWTIPDMDAINLAIQEGAESAVIAGGGFVGVEAAEGLRARGLRVTLVEKAPKVLPPLDPEMAETVHDLLRKNGVDLILGRGLVAIRDDGDRKRVAIEGGDEILADLVILAAGVRPRAELARGAGLAIGDLGGIRVDDRLRTSDPKIFAAGDAIEVTDIVTGRPTLCPLAGPANRQGRIAADNALGRDVRYRGSQGTFIIKVFEGTAAATGANEVRLRAARIRYEKVHIVGQSHATYYPGAEPMFVKLLFAPEGGRILGAQIVGGPGVDKRIDVLATAIRANQTVFDLEDAELAYAPPYGSAKDPVNIAGFVAGNLLRGDVEAVAPEDVPLDAHILDVRTAKERQSCHIPGSQGIPLDELRDRIAEIPRDRVTYAHCAGGQRSYYACRILAGNGIECRNISGGLRHWRVSPGVRGRLRI